MEAIFKTWADFHKYWDQEIAAVEKAFKLGVKRHLFTISEFQSWYEFEIRINKKQLAQILKAVNLQDVEHSKVRGQVSKYVGDLIDELLNNAGFSWDKFKVCEGIDHYFSKETRQSIFYKIEFFYPNCTFDFDSIESRGLIEDPTR